MRILIAAATPAEAAPLMPCLSAVTTVDERLSRGRFGAHEADVLTTGVGMVATAVHVTRALSQGTYDAAMNVGLCGSFDRTLPLASVVHVTSEAFPELGAEDAEAFLPLSALGLGGMDDSPFRGGWLTGGPALRSRTLEQLPRVTGITVNTVHGHTATIAAVTARLNPGVESMEGGAFLYACLVARVPCAQIRAVSNYVERRNRGAWRIDDALAALGRTVAAVLSDL